MKPNNWKSMSKNQKKEYALRLVNSTRGSYILSQALFYGIQELNKAEGNRKEISNIEDMEILREIIFFIFQGDWIDRK